MELRMVPTFYKKKVCWLYLLSCVSRAIIPFRDFSAVGGFAGWMKADVLDLFFPASSFFSIRGFHFSFQWKPFLWFIPVHARGWVICSILAVFFLSSSPPCSARYGWLRHTVWRPSSALVFAPGFFQCISPSPSLGHKVNKLQEFCPCCWMCRLQFCETTV